MAVVKTLLQLSMRYDRFVLIYETDEKSDIIDVLYYLKILEKEIATPDVMLFLDGG